MDNGKIGQPRLIDRIFDAVGAHPAVSAIHLFGSRREGGSTPLSDWDFKIETADKQRVFDELPSIVSGFGPLAAFWDPLGHRRNFMAIFPGPLKVDLHLDMSPLPAHPWRISRETLRAVDSHFWDWTLWLAAKSLKGQQTLVTEELSKMHHYLLGPLGCRRPPLTLGEAVADYLRARGDAEIAHGLTVAGNPLEEEIRDALARYGLT